jgi:V/A-type H+-transporting ATPase subunit I
VGLSGVAVADAFNNMGMSIGFSDIGSALGACLVIVFGHILNMVLSMFAILVHGIRLNVMEFSGHLGLEWAGFRYQPLRKQGV